MYMKRLIFIAFVLLSASTLCAQENRENRDFFRHELSVSFGDALGSNFWFYNREARNVFSATYLFRPINWLWIGGRVSNFTASREYIYRSWSWREYDTHGNYQDFFESESARTSGFTIAPELRLSYLNRPSGIIYSALSVGFGWENLYVIGGESRTIFNNGLVHVTLFGFSMNLGKNRNIFIGGEMGVGYRSLYSAHAGFRF
jgi:hypothetical protein